MSYSFQSYYYDPVFPWTSTRNDERFRRLAKWILAIFIIFGLIVPWLPSPEVEQKQLKQVSPRLAKLITQKRLQKPKIAKVKSVKKKTIRTVAKNRNTPFSELVKALAIMMVPIQPASTPKFTKLSKNPFKNRPHKFFFTFTA